MTVDELIARLQALAADGHGGLEVWETARYQTGVKRMTLDPRVSAVAPPVRKGVNPRWAEHLRYETNPTNWGPLFPVVQL